MILDVKGHWNLKCYECSTSRTLWENLETLGANIYIHSRINWFDFFAPRSMITATSHFVNTTSQECLKGISSNLVHRSSRSDKILEARGQGHCDVAHCDSSISGWPLGSVFKFGTNDNFDSSINWLNYGSQRSKSQWPQSHSDLKACDDNTRRLHWGLFLFFVKFSTTLHLDSRVNWLDFGGQMSL